MNTARATAAGPRKVNDVGETIIKEEKNREYLPRAVYQKSEDELRTWREGMDRFRAEAGGKQAAYVSIFSAALSILSIALWAFSIWRGQA